MSAENFIKKVVTSGKTCCVSSCGISRRQFPNAKLFKFPACDSIFGQIWRDKCHIPESDYNRNLFICDKHFENTFIGNKRLKTDAIPTLFINEERIEDDDYNFCEPPDQENVHFYKCQKCESLTKALNFYRKRYNSVFKKYTRNINKKKIKQNLLNKKKKISRSDVVSKIDALETENSYKKNFCQLLLQDRPCQYSQQQKNLVLNLYYISPAAYNFMRNKLQFNLPHKSSIYRWAPIKHLQPGFKNTALSFLQSKMKELDAENSKYMVLLFDEMSIKKDLKYNSHLDLVDGYEVTDSGRTDKTATQVCVFYLKALFCNWSIPINYFVSHNGLKAENLKNIVIQNLSILNNFGVQVRVLVCDQGPSNRKCFSLLKVSKDSPYFEFNNQKIFCIYDFPHLMKSLRNGWMTSDLKTPDGIASFKVIRELFQKEQNSRTKMCPKLTEQHICPNSFEKMRVKLATQVFSRTVMAAIRTITDTVGFENNSVELALSTANFIEKIDKLFDSMNSGCLYADNSYRSAIQMGNEPYNFIQDTLKYLNEVEFTDKKKTVYFLDGMKLTLRSVIFMAQEFLTENENFYFLMTKSINQDRLENMFSVVRQKGGNNPNPSVQEFNQIMAKIITTKLIKSSELTNCEETNDTHIMASDFDNNVETNNFCTSDVVEKETNGVVDLSYAVNTVTFLEDVFEKSSSINLELVSIRYFIGYVIFKMIPKLKCEICPAVLRKNDEVLSAPSELFIFHKNYHSVSDFGNLIAPSDEFMQVSKAHITTFHQIFKSESHQIGLKQHILKCCIDSTLQWFTNVCHEHRKSILDFLILVLLRKHCKWSSEIKTTKKKES